MPKNPRVTLRILLLTHVAILRRLLVLREPRALAQGGFVFSLAVRGAWGHTKRGEDGT
jgi:hypothetical protein